MERITVTMNDGNKEILNKLVGNYGARSPIAKNINRSSMLNEFICDTFADWIKDKLELELELEKWDKLKRNIMKEYKESHKKK